MSENNYETPKAELHSGDRQIAQLTRSEILFSLKGRIGRKTFWLNYLGMMLVFIIMYVGLLSAINGQTDSAAFAIATLLLYVPLIWIGLALSVKRWHDRNKSGWWVLINFIPFIGGIWVLIENGCLAGDVESNNYGNPSF
jgi:uncharacterized membrane protein YhaH (DUF805 family)